MMLMFVLKLWGYKNVFTICIQHYCGLIWLISKESFCIPQNDGMQRYIMLFLSDEVIRLENRFVYIEDFSYFSDKIVNISIKIFTLTNIFRIEKR